MHACDMVSVTLKVYSYIVLDSTNPMIQFGLEGLSDEFSYNWAKDKDKMMLLILPATLAVKYIVLSEMLSKFSWLQISCDNNGDNDDNVC